MTAGPVDPRVEAAARALAMRYTGGAHDAYAFMQPARSALAAADSVEAPLARRLAEVLRAILLAPTTAEMELRAREAGPLLGEYEATL